MRYFGSPGMGELYKDQPAPTPVGVPCLYCDTPIVEGARGFLLPSAELGHEAPVHQACMVSWIRPEPD